MSEKKSLNIILNFLSMLFFLWIFLLSIKLLGGTFKHYFIGDAAKLIEDTTGNPIVSLVIGILATAIIQSSSSTTTIVVAFVGAGTLPFANAIPMIMGANIGTSITGVIVSFGNIRNKVEFEKSFSSAIVHDFFNWLTVMIFLPLELFTGIISKSALFISSLLVGGSSVTSFDSPLDTIVKPVSKGIEYFFANLLNNPIVEHTIGGKVKKFPEYDLLLLGVMIIISLTLLFIALKYMSKIMKTLLIGKFETILHKFVFNRISTALIFGTLFTMSVQSSSITTSLVVPLVGAGILNLNQVFPYMVGANIGTTITGILGSLVLGSSMGIAIAFVHTFFNIFGALVFIPLKIIPVKAAMLYSSFAVERRIWVIGLIVIEFFIIPLSLIFIFS